MDGFTITCNNCSNSAILTTINPEEYYGADIFYSDSETLTHYSDPSEMIIRCSKCDNQIREET